MQRLSEFTNAELQRHQTTDLMRALSAKWFGQGDPAAYYRAHWPHSIYRDDVAKHFEVHQHAAVAAGTTTDTTWAAPLMVPSLVAGFLPLVRAASVFATLPVTPAPFNTRIAKQTAGGSTKWLGENTTKPVTKFGFGNVLLPWSKCSSIIVVTAELMKLAAPGSVEQLQQTIRDEVTVFVDGQFLSTTAAVANVNPAGILNGVTPVTATASLAADIGTLVATFFANRPNPFAPWFVLSPGVASKIAALDIGRDVTVTGGTLLGLPVAVSSGAGSNAIVVDAPAVMLADGGLDLGISLQATPDSSDAPDSPPTAASVPIPLWEYDLAGIKCERFMHWVVAAANAAQYLPVA